MKLKAIVEKRNALNKLVSEKVEALETEKRSATTEEETEIRELAAQVEQLDEEIRAFEEEAEEETTVETVEYKEEERGHETMPNTKELEVRGLEQFIRKQDGEEVRGLNTTSTGAVIPTHLSEEIIEKLDEIAPLFNMVPKVTPVSGTLEILAQDARATAGFVGEEADLAETNFSFKKVKLEQRRAGNFIELTQHLINDSGKISNATLCA